MRARYCALPHTQHNTKAAITGWQGGLVSCSSLREAHMTPVLSMLFLFSVSYAVSVSEIRIMAPDQKEYHVISRQRQWFVHTTNAQLKCRCCWLVCWPSGAPRLLAAAAASASVAAAQQQLGSQPKSAPCKQSNCS